MSNRSVNVRYSFLYISAILGFAIPYLSCHWPVFFNQFCIIPDYPNDVLLVFLLWIFHYLRRIYECLFVHVYSRQSNWIFELGANVYYAGFGYGVGYDLCMHGRATGPSEYMTIMGVIIFLLGEAGNSYSHLILSRLRSGATKGATFPRGFAFTYLSCPHYFFELVTWIGFGITTGFPVSVIAFTVASAISMTVKARERHQMYLKQFHGKTGGLKYPSSRSIIIPFVY